MSTGFQEDLKLKMHLYLKLIYRLAREFPDYEIYGVTSQLRRAALSVVLNFTEGYARFKTKDKLRFYEISYASFKETKYLVYFSHSENYIKEEDYQSCLEKGEEIGKMLWKLMEPLRDK